MFNVCAPDEDNVVAAVRGRGRQVHGAQLQLHHGAGLLGPCGININWWLKTRCAH